MASETKKIAKALEKELDAKRYEHTIGVEYTAAALAMAHGASVKDAQMAGLLHDCAKGIPAKEKLVKAKKHGIEVSDFEKRNPDMLHAKLGAYYAKAKYS